MIYRNDYINRDYRNQKYYRQETIIMRGNRIMGFVWIILAVCLLGILLYKINFSSHAGPRGRFGMGGKNNLLLSTNGGDGPVFLPGSYKLVESKQFDASEIDSFDFNITRETLWVQQVDDKKYTVEYLGFLSEKTIHKSNTDPQTRYLPQSEYYNPLIHFDELVYSKHRDRFDDEAFCERKHYNHLSVMVCLYSESVSLLPCRHSHFQLSYLHLGASSNTPQNRGNY